jgi:hypothetical protein
LTSSSSDVAADRPVSDFADTEGEEYLQEALRFLSKESNRRSDGLRPSKPQEPRDPMPLLDVAHVMIARWLGLKPSHRMETKWVRSGSRCSCGAAACAAKLSTGMLGMGISFGSCTNCLLRPMSEHQQGAWMRCKVMRLSPTAEALLHTAPIAAFARHTHHHNPLAALCPSPAAPHRT